MAQSRSTESHFFVPRYQSPFVVLWIASNCACEYDPISWFVETIRTPNSGHIEYLQPAAAKIRKVYVSLCTTLFLCTVPCVAESCVQYTVHPTTSVYTLCRQKEIDFPADEAETNKWQCEVVRARIFLFLPTLTPSSTPDRFLCHPEHLCSSYGNVPKAHDKTPFCVFMTQHIREY